MNAVRCVACVVLVISILDVTRARDFNVIFDSLPSDIGNAISSAWRGVIKAIKTPIRPRRFRRGKKRKMTSPTTTEFSVPLITVPSTKAVSTDAPRRPTIPFITRPDWTSFLDWRLLQNPNLVKLARKYHNRGPPYYGGRIESYEETTVKLSTSEEEVFEHTILKMDTKGQRKKIDIPVIQTPEYKYESPQRFKFRNDNYTTSSAPDAVSHHGILTSSTIPDISEDRSSLLKQFNFGKYRLKIFYKISLQ